jgi:hypothetical protein
MATATTTTDNRHGRHSCRRRGPPRHAGARSTRAARASSKSLLACATSARTAVCGGQPNTPAELRAEKLRLQLNAIHESRCQTQLMFLHDHSSRHSNRAGAQARLRARRESRLASRRCCQQPPNRPREALGEAAVVAAVKAAAVASAARAAAATRGCSRIPNGHVLCFGHLEKSTTNRSERHQQKHVTVKPVLL